MSRKLLTFRTLFWEQRRNAWILKRQEIPYLKSTYENKLVVGGALKQVNPDLPLREKEDSVYSAVRQTDDETVPDSRILLLDHVKGLGVAGDIVNVDPNYFRFDLLLNHKATYASDLHLEIYRDLLLKKDQDTSGPSSALSQLTIEKLSQSYVVLNLSSKEPWTIEKWHVRTAFRKLGFIVPDYAIDLPKTKIVGPDIEGKQNKDFAVFITVNKREKIPVRCVVHHHGVFVPENWKTKNVRVPILPEQKELLESMFSLAIEEEEEF
ncbi:39S ribosomal protein L9-like protein [Leptotrombidium deliense]|uniref:Large ribosomal subunit protein bL9m n=1 Tax=Leptotrombidium deliense TaxID=299467 RepID=A0A443SPM8_9ACAR|nr:39S ribosomal protein L9-like protein [Leptotrombidium deliense]